MYAPALELAPRFHSGPLVFAAEPCGVWQNTQISVVPVADLLAEVLPVDRSCRLFWMPANAGPPGSVRGHHG